MTHRSEIIEKFLTAAHWQTATRQPLAGDASTRSYTKLIKPDETRLLMDAPPQAETVTCPVEATPSQRQELGYNALARLAGGNLNAFRQLATRLRHEGIATPEIYAADAQQGLALMEFLGDQLFKTAIEQGQDELTLYRAATDVLSHLHRRHISIASPDYTLQTYDQTAMLAEIDLLSEWYIPFTNDAHLSEKAYNDYMNIWQQLLTQLSPLRVIVLRDYHAENLIWREQRKGLARVGVIDFQDALIGQPAYDLVSLLEDARRDVDPGTVLAVRQYYHDTHKNDSDYDKDIFSKDFDILAAQRNAKILGIFARLVRRDQKPAYEALLPRVRNHFKNDLLSNHLTPLRLWAEQHMAEIFA